jgi:hypothetical protein
MRQLLMLALLAATNSAAQELKVEVPQAAPPVQAQAPAEQEKQAVTVPAGTRVALTLTNAMRVKTAHPGDSVRAVIAFPVTVGKQVVIPAGTYVEGLIDRVLKRAPTGHAGLEMHFTRIVFANGYNVVLDGANAIAQASEPDLNLLPAAFPEGRSTAASALGQQQPPPLPPLPRVGPSIGEVTGIGVGVLAAVTVTAILLGRRHAGDVVFDEGYQFEMVLETSLILDADRVAAAVAGSAAR